LAAGADINKADNYKTTPLYIASQKDLLEIVKALLAAGADVNKTKDTGATPLFIASYKGHIEVLKTLLAAGADINKPTNNGLTPIQAALEKGYVDIVVELIKKGADFDINSITSFASEQGTKELIDLLKEKGVNLKSNTLNWKRSNATKYNIIFDDNIADVSNFSACPVCLKTVIRSEACMYMNHNCSKERGFYHKELYNKYKNQEGNIFWCTSCGRIALGHRHYKLLPHDKTPSTNTLVVAPGADVFERDCSVSNGGGGPLEKYARFRAIRNKAHELSGKNILIADAHKKLVEAAWDVPLTMDKAKLKANMNAKVWNIPHEDFKPNVLPPPEKAIVWNDPNILQPGSWTGLDPEIVDSGTNIMTYEDAEVIYFKHPQPDGSVYDHKDNNTMISRESLIDFIESQIKNFGAEQFGYCYLYPTCKGIMYPSQIKEFVPDKLYEEYRKKFNKYVKDKLNIQKGVMTANIQKGGDANNILKQILIPAEDAKCVIVPKSKMGGFKKTKKRNMKRLVKSSRKNRNK
jgi:hypothetical protein